MQPSVNIQSPIVRDAPLNRGLLRWWLCLPNQFRGNVWRDLTRKSDITIGDATVVGSRGRPGGFGAWDFDGTNDYGQTAAIELTSVTTLTIAFWMYKTSFSNAIDKLMLETSASATNNAAIGISPDSNGANFFVRIRASAGFNSVSMAHPTASVWHHYVITMDRNAGSQQVTAIYVDGVSKTLTPVGTTTTATNGFGNYQWNFGARNGGASFWAPQVLDDFSIRNRIISASEARELYRESAKGYPRLLRWIDSSLATFASQGVANSYWAWNTYGAVA